MIPVPVLNNRVYDVLKYIAQIVLPAFGALYYGLASVWGLPEADKVVGSIVVIDTFLGALLNLSSKAYNSSEAKFDGDAVISGAGAEKKVTFEFNDHPVEMAKVKDELTFKVKGATKKPAKKTTKPAKIVKGEVEL